MLGYPDGGYERADEAFFRAMIAFEEDQQLRDEMNEGLAEELGYDPDELETDELEALADYGAL